MNYEEKYNEILEWARKNKARLNGVPIEEVLPELRESEDERIINQLITLVNSAGEFLLIPTYKEELVAWLEKQKEEEGYEAIPVESTLEYKLGFKAGKESEKQKEQKPAEWSEEDEKYLNRVINLWVNDFDEDSDTVKWLKSLRPSWKPSEEQIEALRRAANRLAKTDVADSVRLSIMYDNLKKL